jgi:hypothetical protein
MSRTSDDFYAYLTSSRAPETIIGRIPAKNNHELNAYLDKLQEYLTNPNPGWWQYTFQLIADDEHYNRQAYETSHTTQIEGFSRLIDRNILVDKLFAIEYDLDPNRKKPHVRDILVDKLNEGRLYWLYMGHGSIRNLGDEGYFNATDIQLLRNTGKYPIFIAGSCDVGQYCLPTVVSLAEELVLRRDVGAIIAIAATGKSTGAANASLFTRLLGRAVNENRSPGEALMLAKQGMLSDLNARYYNILGDPFLRVAYPILSNNISFAADIDTLKIRQTVTGMGNFDQAITGRITHNLVYDSGISYTHTFWNTTLNQNAGGWTSLNLTKENLPIFNGRSSLTNSAYNFGFIVPQGTSSGNRGKIFSMAICTETNQVYVNRRTNIPISNEVMIVENNDVPEIKLYMDNRRFQAGDLVSPRPILIADISDDNGLKTIGSPGHNMMIYIDGQSEVIIATSGFEYNVDSFTTGTLTWRLEGLESGTHHLRLIVFDSFNAHSVAETWFVTTGEIPINITNALVYPNPMRQGGHFTFDLSHNADVTINIFTITGRRVQTIRRHNVSKGFVSNIYWDGRDADGHRMANNTYFYTIRANATEGRGSDEITDKLMILR